MTADAEPQRVARTGIALVHLGERIYAPEDASAALVPDQDRVVHYYFPIEVEVLGLGSHEAFAARIYEALRREISALG